MKNNTYNIFPLMIILLSKHFYMWTSISYAIERHNFCQTNLVHLVRWKFY